MYCHLYLDKIPFLWGNEDGLSLISSGLENWYILVMFGDTEFSWNYFSALCLFLIIEQ